MIAAQCETAAPERLARSRESLRVPLRRAAAHLQAWMRLSSMTDNLTCLPPEHPTVWNSAEVARHNRRGDCWMAIQGKVYDVTAYLEFHPGGAEELMRGAGLDATSLFAEAHAWVNFEAMLASSIVGRLDESAPDHGTAGGHPAVIAGAAAVVGLASAAAGPAAAASAGADAAAGRAPSLLAGHADAAAATTWHSVKLLRRRSLAATGRDGLASSAARTGPPCEEFEFALPDDSSTLWRADQPAGAHLQVELALPVVASAADAAQRIAAGQLVVPSATPSAGSSVVREFTPVGGMAETGSFALAVKLYPRGKASRLLSSLAPGDSVRVRGPRGPFRYSRGRADVGGLSGARVSALLLAGGGSGVTPALQVARAAAEDAEDSTPVHLLLCHSGPGQSMLVPEAVALAATHPDQVHLTVAYSELDAEGSAEAAGSAAVGANVRLVRGRMSAELLRAAWPAPHAEHVVAWCGPHGFNSAADAAARQCFYVAERMHEF